MDTKVLRFVYDTAELSAAVRVPGETFRVVIYVVEDKTWIWCGKMHLTPHEWAVFQYADKATAVEIVPRMDIPTVGTVPDVRRILCSNTMMYDAEGNMIGRN